MTELVSISKINCTFRSDIPKFHLELDFNILNFYQNGEYMWSKFISLKYTSGVYFLLRDKIFTVIENGHGRIECFNFDGTPFKTFSLCMDYIRHAEIVQDEYLAITGFFWGPIELVQIIQIDSLFKVKLKYKTVDLADYPDVVGNFDADDLYEDI